MTNSLYTHYKLNITRLCASIHIQPTKLDRQKYTALKTLTWLLIFVATNNAANAQAPVVNCPSAPLIFQDSTDNSPLFWNADYWWETNIDAHDLGDGAAPLEISAKNNCPNGNLTFHFKLRLDLTGDHIVETLIDSDQLPNANQVPFNNINHPPSYRGFDFRPVPNNQKWGFALKVLPPDSTNTQKALVIWRDSLGNETIPLLPHSTHQITWEVTDTCGLTDTCNTAFVVRDAVAPQVSCVQNLSVNLDNPVSGLTIWNSDFIDTYSDNYSPTYTIQIGIRRAGTGFGFPSDFALHFDCFNYGSQDIELWVRDQAGNTAFCMTSILVSGDCDWASGDNLSCIHFSYPGIIGELNNLIVGPGNTPPPVNIPITNGCFEATPLIDLPGPFQISPMLNTDPLNGVSTWDMVLISRHILNQELFDSPYKLIAADVNNNGTVTTFDIVEIRKLILGVYDQFPDNSSWRFIDQGQIFTDAANPFADSLHESLPILFLGDQLAQYNFTVIKIADVDDTVVVPNLLSPDDRNAPFTAFHITRNDAKHWLVNKGETVELSFTNPTELSGYQMTLESDGLQPSVVIPGTGMSSDHFALFDNAVTTVFEQGNTPFSIRFIAEKNGDLRDMIQVSSRITPAMAFGENGEKMQINLRFEGEKSNVSPNPWSDHTRINFYTPEATNATLKVFDMAGLLVHTETTFVEKGEQAFELNTTQVPVTGTLLYEIVTKNGVMREKMTHLDYAR